MSDDTPKSTTQVKEKTTIPKHPEVKVRLTERDCASNAYAIVTRCWIAAQKAGLTREEIKAFRQEALYGDYDNLLATCKRWFILCRRPLKERTCLIAVSSEKTKQDKE